MAQYRYIFYLIALIAAHDTAWAQKRPELAKTSVEDTIPSIRLLEINPRIVKGIDTVWQYSGICKTLKISKYVGGQKAGDLSTVSKKSGVTIHGNVLYDFLYRSYADTPYYQRDFRQHTIQSSMTVTVKEKYSYRVNLGIRLSNSPYFKNFLIGGLQFDRNAFLVKAKQRAEGMLMERTIQNPELGKIEATLKDLLVKYNAIEYSLNKPNKAQLLIEERERIYFDQLRSNVKAPKLEKDTSLKVEKYISEKKDEMDSLHKRMLQLLDQADSIKRQLYQKTTLVRQKINKSTSANDLRKVLAEYDLLDEKQDKWERTMAAVRSIGIGRSAINYSELTVNNVLLTGLNVEYNPRFYTAFAAGKIDYGFRDFMGRNKAVNKQQLVIGRFGFGDIDRKAVILSLYTGRKYNYGNVLHDTVNSYINVTGYSVEGILRKNENLGMSFEVAKSTRPVSGSIRDNKETKSLIHFSDKTNQAISLKGQVNLPKSATRLGGFFRKSGENFQSFSLFTYNTDQTAWLLKADQSLFKDRVTLTAMLRQNDFTNPFSEKTFKTSTIFTSAQLSVRVPRWPLISLGYHPGSQLYIIDKQRIRENVYYIMNGSILHTYSLGGLRMMSSVIYNYYASKGVDSGFINYSGATYIVSHSLLFKKMQFTGNFINTDQRELQFFTLEASGEFFPSAYLKLGAGGKYNRTSLGATYWGGKAHLTVEIGKLGGLQLQYDRSFLPTVYQTLAPVDIGRLSWFKNF